jgi:hypothetical protein
MLSDLVVVKDQLIRIHVYTTRSLEIFKILVITLVLTFIFYSHFVCFIFYVQQQTYPILHLPEES